MNAGLRERTVRGVAFVDLVKFFRNFAKTRPLPKLSPAASELLTTRLSMSTPYSLDALHELLRVLDELVVRGDESRALEMGAAGGSTFEGVLKTYVTPGDPRSSVLAMRHGFRAHYNFGTLTAEEVSPGKVHFRLKGYDDLPMPFALMMAGWALGAARRAGSKTARVEVLDRPWRGAASFVYVVHC